MALVSWQRKSLRLTDVSTSCVSGEREEILHRSRDGRFPDDPATFASAALREDAGPLAEATAIGGVFGVGCFWRRSARRFGQIPLRRTISSGCICSNCGR